jgi:hypothetical protein
MKILRLILLTACLSTLALAADAAKSLLIVLTDMGADPDDEQSLAPAGPKTRTASA